MQQAPGGNSTLNIFGGSDGGSDYPPPRAAPESPQQARVPWDGGRQGSGVQDTLAWGDHGGGRRLPSDAEEAAMRSSATDRVRASPFATGAPGGYGTGGYGAPAPGTGAYGAPSGGQEPNYRSSGSSGGTRGPTYADAPSARGISTPFATTWDSPANVPPAARPGRRNAPSEVQDMGGNNMGDLLSQTDSPVNRQTGPRAGAGYRPSTAAGGEPGSTRQWAGGKDSVVLGGGQPAATPTQRQPPGGRGSFIFG